MLVPPNGWFVVENPFKMDDFGVPFMETVISPYSSNLQHVDELFSEAGKAGSLRA